MKVISEQKAESLLKENKAHLEWSTISIKFFIRVTMPYAERIKQELDSSYTVQYKTGLRLQQKYQVKNF